MEHILSVWPRIAEQLKLAYQVRFFADYDGTLTPIAQRPELAILPDYNRRLLEMLAEQSNVIVSVVSGRSIVDLKKLVQVNNIIYAGNHGMEIEGPGIEYRYPLAEDIKVLFRILSQVLAKALSGISGVIVEDKGLTISVHYRLVDRRFTDDVMRIFTLTIGGLNAAKKVKITAGKEVLEVRPVTTWNKGKAVKLLMNKRGRLQDKVVPIFLGDDLTDEDAFSQINKYTNGIAVFVGDNYQTTTARYYLHSSSEVTLLLKRLVGLLRENLDDTVL